MAKNPTRAANPGPTSAPAPTWWQALAASRIPGWVVLPLRLFLGLSFLAAGFDKLTDPSYLDPSAAGYIGHQISEFAPGTPLEGFLLNFAVPNAGLFGLLVMGGEVCIGIAVLLGLFTRFSAAMGLLLNLTFFLSATWAVRPFYFGADLPYVFAWLTLMLAGSGPLAMDLLVRKWLTPQPVTYSSKGRMVTVEDTGTAMTRRAFLGAGAATLTVITLAATGLGWGALNSGKRGTAIASGAPTPTPTPTAGSAAQAPTAAPTPTSNTAQVEPPTSAPAAPTATQAADNTAGQTKIASPDELPVDQGMDFTLPNGQPAVLVRTANGYSAYVAVCTHEGCKVSYRSQFGVIMCPCHGAQFDAANGGAVLRGPARRPLSAIALNVAPDGSVYLAA